MTTESITPGTIVVGYAGSIDDDHAVKWAAEQAVLEGRTLTVAHAVQPLTGYEFGAMAGAYLVPDDVADSLQQEGRALLAAASESVSARFPGLHVETAMYEGNPAQMLLEHAPRAACIVVGSRGRGRVASVLLGSVGVTVARNAACPVVVVRPHHPGKVRNGVLVGTDCTENTCSTLEYAYREASLRQLPLTVLHAVPDGDLEDPRRQLAEVLAGMGEKFPDVRVRTCLGSGAPDKWLAKESDSMDLVVVGHHHHHSGPADLVGGGSAALAVVEQATCPVAVISEAPVAHLV